MSRPKYGFSNYSDSVLADEALQIYNMMSVNPQFPNPPIAYPALNTLIQGFNSAISNALNRDKVMVTQKREVREDLEHALKSLAIYIMSITENALEIEQTGFDVVQPGMPVGIPAAPNNVRTASIAQGTVHVEWKRVRGANSYVVEATTGNPESPATVWTKVALPTQCRATIEGLTALTYYWFRVRAIGAAGEGLASQPAMGLSM